MTITINTRYKQKRLEKIQNKNRIRKHKYFKYINSLKA